MIIPMILAVRSTLVIMTKIDGVLESTILTRKLAISLLSTRIVFQNLHAFNLILLRELHNIYYE